MNSQFAIIIALASTIAVAAPASGVDLNNNGMSDVWEYKYSVAPDAGAEHYDGDGFTNLQESVLGTDPFDLLSRANLEMIRDPAQSELRLRIDTAIGKLYEVQTSNDLVMWSMVGPVITGTGAPVDVITTLPDASVTAGFFRYRCIGDVDADGDSLTAWEEAQLGSSDATGNSDTDDLTDLEEFRLIMMGVTVDLTKEFTIPGVRDGEGDADGDGVPDKDELRGGTNAGDPESYPAGHPLLDSDRDGLKDSWEIAYFGNTTFPERLL